jgi:hypothetical protein
MWGLFFHTHLENTFNANFTTLEDGELNGFNYF